MSSRRPKSRPASSGRGFAVILLGLLAAGAAVYLSCLTRGSEETPPKSPSSSAKRPERHGTSPKPGRHEPSTQPPSQGRVTTEHAHQGARIALVIDDLGHSTTEVEEIEGLGVTITYAVLPYEEETAAVVAELRGRGEEILCHLPMEPEGANDPGPGALRSAMTDDELEVASERALAEIPGAVGVNNHMGSELSADRRAMRPVLQLLARRHLFYLDSRTSPKSVGYRMAIELGIPAAERQVFLDGAQSPEAIRAQFARLLDLARKRGAAIAIGHPHPTTLAVLADEIPKAKAQGFEFVPVSYLLDTPGNLPE